MPRIEATYTRPDLLPLSKTGELLLGDFHRSYRFSQGDGDGQNSMFSTLAQCYRTNLSSPEKVSLVGELTHIGRHAAALTAPLAHADRDKMFGHPVSDEMAPQYLLSQFENDWARLRRHFDVIHTKRYFMKPRTPADIALLMVARDSKYQSEPRPGGARRKDPHASFFRTYVLLDTPTGSPTFNAIFDQARHDLAAEDMTANPEIAGLVYAWRANHPGQQFFAGYADY